MASSAMGEHRAASDPARVSQHWEAQFAKNRADTSLWTNNHIVARHINELITDTEQHWLPWFFNCYLSPDRVFAKSLSICCGDAAHELGLASTGRVKFVSGFDISEGAVSQAHAAFAAAGVNPANYRFEVADANAFDLNEPADLMLSTGALHHVADLETLLSRLAKQLTADGYFIVVEYVGPNRFQWRLPQVNAVNAIVDQLDVRYVRDGIRTKLGAPALEEIIAIDPSEAVRAEEILPLLREHFAIEYLREFNGTILHPLYPLLNPALTNAGASDFDSIVRLVLLIEDRLIQAKRLSSDFVFAICRPKQGGQASAPSDETKRLRAAYVGYIDGFDETGVHGWAANRASLDTAIRVDLYLGDQLHATLRADGFRGDLLQAGLGNGSHGFAVNLASRAPAGTIASLTISGTNHVLATRVFGSG